MSRLEDFEITPGPVSDAAATGDRVKMLNALRNRLAQAIDLSTSDGGLAALTAKMLDVLAALEKVPAERKGTPLDELAKRRGPSSKVPA